MNEKQLLLYISQVSFALTEIVLFLNTHPNCKEALEYYHKLRALRQEAVTNYEKQFGPLMQDGNNSTCSWDWTKTPWPWEN